MPLVKFIQHDGEVVEAEVESGRTLLEAAIAAGIEGECGGCASCGTCHVFVDMEHFARLKEADTLEKEILEYGEIPCQSTSRLCCQIVMSEELDGIALTMPNPP